MTDLEGYDESFMRHVRRGESAEWEDEASRVRPPRTHEEILAYHERVVSWITALLSKYTSTYDESQGFTAEMADQLDQEFAAMPRKAKVTLNRLYLQSEVLVWMLNSVPSDLVEDTRDRVEAAGVDMYELEDAYKPEPCAHENLTEREMTDNYTVQEYICGDCNEIIPRRVADDAG